MGKTKEVKKKKLGTTEEKLLDGTLIAGRHSLFKWLGGSCSSVSRERIGKDTAAVVDRQGTIYLNRNYLLEPEQWAYVIAHCKLHLAFGHFDAERMPGEEVICPDGRKEWKVTADRKLWNLACDIYITKFLSDMKFGRSIASVSLDEFRGSLSDEIKIYHYLEEKGVSGDLQEYGTAAVKSMDMKGLEKPVVYEKGQQNRFVSRFAWALSESAREAVSISGGHGKLHSFPSDRSTEAEEARSWFVNHYPLLGSLASNFEIIYDSSACVREEISIAAIDIYGRKIYINPAARLSNEEMKFVIAHELLHAGLCHQERCQGRDPYLWNVACDYVINGWLMEMQIGRIPEQSLLYDEAYRNWSAESIYDEILKEFRKNQKLNTFRGYRKGDMLDRNANNIPAADYVTLDEFCRSALAQGLEYQLSSRKRGTIPAGLIEEIRALSMPAVPWDVELARWFDSNFPPVDKHYTYARPSRRQGATPDIPRPRYVKQEIDSESRTFGVIIDTSGSMTAKMIGMALGAAASYAAAKDVPFVRVVFCDAHPYDAGYLASEDIAGRVEVKGRGGTRMQPAIDLLEQAEDFPDNGPILLITDGYIENSLNLRHKHAYLIPKGHRLPFKAKGEVFYFS